MLEVFFGFSVGLQASKMRSAGTTPGAESALQVKLLLFFSFFSFRRFSTLLRLFSALN